MVSFPIIFVGWHISRTHTDAGAIFSGSAITKWLMTHISGVKSENDAQMLGQLLLENGLILHSEGSRQVGGSQHLSWGGGGGGGGGCTRNTYNFFPPFNFIPCKVPTMISSQDMRKVAMGRRKENHSGEAQVGERVCIPPIANRKP